MVSCKVKISDGQSRLVLFENRTFIFLSYILHLCTVHPFIKLHFWVSEPFHEN